MKSLTSFSLALLLGTFFFGIAQSSNPDNENLTGISLDLSSDPMDLTYHNGTVLSSPHPRQVYFLWYGNFTTLQKSIVSDFISSFSLPYNSTHPSVSKWWTVAEKFLQKVEEGGRCILTLGTQGSDPSCFFGKNIKRNDVGNLLNYAITKKLLPLDSTGIYLIFTANDVHIERFCMNSCGFHAAYPFSPTQNLVYAWVGNPATACPGHCAWPFDLPQFGSQSPALIPPNGDVGIDGMIINLASLLAGMATNPFNTGFYQGDPSVPMEASSACTGLFGKGSYPGYAGELSIDQSTGASYNTYGINDRKFLVPSIFNPSTRQCWMIS